MTRSNQTKNWGSSNTLLVYRAAWTYIKMSILKNLALLDEFEELQVGALVLMKEIEEVQLEQMEIDLAIHPRAEISDEQLV